MLHRSASYVGGVALKIFFADIVSNVVFVDGVLAFLREGGRKTSLECNEEVRMVWDILYRTIKSSTDAVASELFGVISADFEGPACATFVSSISSRSASSACSSSK